MKRLNSYVPDLVAFSSGHREARGSKSAATVRSDRCCYEAMLPPPWHSARLQNIDLGNDLYFHATSTM